MQSNNCTNEFPSEINYTTRQLLQQKYQWSRKVKSLRKGSLQEKYFQDMVDFMALTWKF